MIDYRMIERKLVASLRFERRPVAISFLDGIPAAIEGFHGTVPSACSFWRLASEGRSFYALPSDHYNCAVGAYTHHIALPPDRSKELDKTIEFMSSVGYIRAEEAFGIPQLLKEPRAVVYAPLGETPMDPDVVLFIGPPNCMMLLQEAAIRAGVAAQVSALARPTCMALPRTMTSGFTMSAGCVGNRVYTDIGNSDMYVAVPGRDVPEITNAAQAIATANAALLEYHTERRQQLTTT
jgi:uncharacterized protein (DUF169 family)